MAVPQKTVNQVSLVAKKRQAPSQYAPSVQRATSRIVARSLGTYVPKLTRTAFEKFGFSTAALLTDWPQIVGKALAETTTPDRIKWPRSPGAVDGDGAVKGPRAGATLHLRVDPARALDVQYKTNLIIDRINAYFGYRAVAGLRIVQTPVAARTAVAPAAKPRMAPSRDPAIETIADDGLRAALERMQAAMQSRSR